jgi:hypothetical protein
MVPNTTNTVTLQESFFCFIWRSRGNRLYLVTAAAVSMALFYVFKLFYPYPDMVMDTFVYTKAAVFNMDANSFPVGYSKFLQIFGVFSRSTVLLAWVQYQLLELSCLLFFFTLLFFFRPGKWISHILFTFLFFNPILFYISNCVMADALFITISLLWLTQLIWIIGHPKPHMVFIHAVLLLLAFSVRYNALYYPFAALFFILLSRLKPWVKIGAIALEFALIGLFILYTSSQMERLTGVRQFSPFGGWKLANNALYMYGHVCQERNDTIPLKFAQLDNIVRKFFTRTKEVDDLMNYESFSTGTLYAAASSSPLLQYMYLKYGYDTIFQNFKKWGPMGAYCGEYGSYLVRKYPSEFAHYFIWPNIVRYAIPPLEIFAYRDPYLRTDDIALVTYKWFGIKYLKFNPDYVRLRTTILANYPMLIVMLHLFFLLGSTGFFFFKVFRRVVRSNTYIVIAVAGLWLCDFCFGITASAIVLRYQIFLMILEFSFGLLLTNFIYQNDNNRSRTGPNDNLNPN